MDKTVRWIVSGLPVIHPQSVAKSPCRSGPTEFSSSQRPRRTDERSPESRRLRVSWFHAPCDAKETHFAGQNGGSERQCADGCEIHQAVRLLRRRRSHDDSWGRVPWRVEWAQRMLKLQFLAAAAAAEVPGPAAACRPIPISIAVFFGNATSCPRAKKPEYTDIPAPYAPIV